MTALVMGNKKCQYFLVVDTFFVLSNVLNLSLFKEEPPGVHQNMDTIGPDPSSVTE